MMINSGFECKRWKLNIALLYSTVSSKTYGLVNVLYDLLDETGAYIKEACLTLRISSARSCALC